MSDYGVFFGTQTSNLTQFEGWVGSDVESIGVHTGRANWADWSGSIGWAINTYTPLDRPMTWTIPLFSNDGNLTAAAHGDYTNYYTQAAQKLAAAYAGDDQIIVRTGEEFNSSWMPWSAIGHEQDYIKAYQNFVDAFRAVSDKFVFVWSPNIGDNGMDPAKAYPGDAYVDVISMDFYYNTQWDPKDASSAFNYMVTRKYGLQWLEDFADAHNKPSAYPEWGITGNANADAYVKDALKWFQDHDVVYANYFDSGSSLLNGTDATSLAYKAAFGADKTPNPLADVKTVSHPVVGPTEFNGDAGANKLVGDAAANILDGKAGADTMLGGAGDDTYVVDNAKDVVTELANQGTDLVKSSVNYTLGANVENLTLTGAAAINGVGNELNNLIVGNSGANVLDGKAGADTMHGGDGNDTYYVDNVGDVVSEEGTGGIDTVWTTVTHVMGVGIENLIMSGTASINATGNALDNNIRGNAGNNVLSGGDGADTLDGIAGVDTLIGGAGNDTFVVYSANDKVVEAVNGGVDTVIAGASYTLPDNVENLQLRWASPITGVGNGLNNVIDGNSAANTLSGLAGADTLNGGAGADRLIGGLGADRLVGGTGADTFVFEPGDKSRDVIADFGLGGEKDVIDISAFLKAGYKPVVTDVGADAVISFGTGDSILVVGQHANHLIATSSGFVFG